jgi:hypothetical protein
MKIHQLPKLIGIIIFISIANSCRYKTLPTAEVNYLSSKDGTITMRAIGIGVQSEDAINDAEKNALNVLLFRGLPESEQKVALIGTNETEEKNKHKEYFNKLYYEKRYKTFVMSSIPTTDLILHKGGKKSIAVDIKINLVALRKDLEQNNIIRKFGF